MPRKKKDEENYDIVVTLRDLWQYKHLRLAWFARLAFRYTIREDLFNEGANVLGKLNEYNERVKAILSKLGIDVNKKGNNYIINPDDDDKIPDNIPSDMQDLVKDFMEHIRQYGGAGKTRRSTYGISQAVIKAARMGVTLGKIGQDKYIILDIPTEVSVYYVNAFDKIRDRFKDFDVWENIPSENVPLVYAASVIVKNAEELGDEPIILYYITESKAVVSYELTDLINTVRRLRIYNTYIRLIDGAIEKLVTKKPRRPGERAKKVLPYNNVKALLSNLTYAIMVYNFTEDLKPLYGALRMLTSNTLNKEGAQVYGDNWQEIVRQLLSSINRALVR